MKPYNIYRSSFNSLIGLSAFFVFAAAVNAAQTIQISSSEAPPYSSKSVAEYGYANHMIQCAFAKQDIAVVFVFMPWSRAYKDTKDGQFAASSYWYSDPRHEENFLLSAPLTNEKIVLFRRKNEAANNWQNLTDFSKLRLGLTRGYTYTKEVWEYAENNAFYVSVVNSDAQNLKMLLLDRIDLFPVDEIIGWYLLKNSFAAEQVHLLETMQPPLMVKTGHLLFSKKYPNAETLLQNFNAGLEKCKEDGKLQEYTDNLILGYYKQKI
jgi:polar amino acid transport system substrate-binding protein